MKNSPNTSHAQPWSAEAEKALAADLAKRQEMSTPKRIAFNAGQRELESKGVPLKEIIKTSTTTTVIEGYKRGLKRVGAVAALGAMAAGGIGTLKVAAERDNNQYQQQISHQEKYPGDQEVAQMQGGNTPEIEKAAHQANMEEQAQQPSPADIHPLSK